MSTTILKILASIIMLFDHIGEFIPNSPMFFRWAGRLSAPIFFFCTAWGYHYTKNRKTYVIRLYLFSVLMGVLNYSFNLIMFDSKYQYIENNIFRTLFSFVLILYVLDKYKESGYKRKYIVYYILWQLCTSGICLILLSSTVWFYDITLNILCPLLGNLFMVEGGLVFVALGIGFYGFKEKRRYLCIFYLLFCFLFSVLTFSNLIPRVAIRLDYYGFDLLSEGINLFCDYFLQMDSRWKLDVSYPNMFTTLYQWMMVGALPFLLSYNGKKGKGYKYFFYWFYPIHIILLYCIGNLIFLGAA